MLICRRALPLLAVLALFLTVVVDAAAGRAIAADDNRAIAALIPVAGSKHGKAPQA